VYRESFDGDREYLRLEPGECSDLVGRKVPGHGTISGCTNCEGELHPCLIHFYGGGEDVTAEELRRIGFAPDN
jgi:hypothetical protein